jgi:hypothetical protein
MTQQGPVRIWASCVDRSSGVFASMAGTMRTESRPLRSRGGFAPDDHELLAAEVSQPEGDKTPQR